MFICYNPQWQEVSPRMTLKASHILLVKLCSGLNVYISPSSYVESLNPTGWYLEVGFEAEQTPWI